MIMIPYEIAFLTSENITIYGHLMKENKKPSKNSEQLQSFQRPMFGNSKIGSPAVGGTGES